MTTAPAAPFGGYRILVVEDEYILAAVLLETLTSLGAEPLGPLGTVEQALSFLSSPAADRMDVALLDVNLRGRFIWPVADALRARRIPIVLMTGYDRGSIPAAYASLPRCQKPVAFEELRRTLVAAMP